MNLNAIPRIDVADIELPKEFSGLYELAYNFWWAWTPRARRLFHTIDPESWATYRNPVQLLINVEPQQWEPLLHSDSFLADYHSLMGEFKRSMSSETPGWFQHQHPEYSGGPIAYFSTEFGLHECFNIYSGGLGVLSGDHCKSASDLGIPFVAVGLLYRRGYFRQTVDADGMQQHVYPKYDFHRLPVRPVATATGKPLLVPVDLPGRTVQAKVWIAEVGRVSLLLLDTDIAENDPADRPITASLYVRGRSMRLAQEMLLGVGGVRALRALDIQPAAWHMNEGHSAFLMFERLREAPENQAPTPVGERLASLREDTVFTTHTPVPAGNEQFDRDLARGYLEPWEAPLRASTDELLALGQVGDDPSFNLTALALRSSGIQNGVSQLHADVSNEMWASLLAQWQGARIQGITNGVHTGTWLGVDLLELLNRRLGPGWQERHGQEDFARAVESLDAGEVWAAHGAQKQRLANFVRHRLRDQLARHGRSPEVLRTVADRFDPGALTIGFARRFATYKRAALLFSDLERLTQIVANDDRPVQILISGKAHPADRPGQDLIKHIFELSNSPALRGRVYFLEDYDMEIGRRLVQGVDVWLNTPRRPMEASGTSGQKAGANGVLNLSVLDGWWPEAFDRDNGWAVGDGTQHSDEGHQDHEDARSLYETLENEVVPVYYDRDANGVPHEWVRRMKHSIGTVLLQFSSDRMVRDYVERCYLPASRGEREPVVSH